ncbi:MAG: dehalogenase [Dehalococcoidaceae bacterium]|nr:dehalogenase [Dehalococcoidaceae bacterium]
MWFVAGLLIGCGLLALGYYARSKGAGVKWYEIVMGVTGVILLLVAIHDFFAFRAEYEPQAGWVFLCVIGIPGILLILLAGFLVWFRYRKNSVGPTGIE